MATMENKGAHGDRTTDTVLSVLISFAAFGLWVVLTAGSLLWTILAFLPVIMGLVSLYEVLREAKAGVTSSCPATAYRHRDLLLGSLSKSRR